MKGLAPLFLGIFGTFAFSWIGLTVIPTWQIGHLNPESDEEGTDIYPRPQSGMFARGEHVYAANGCVYCHSQQVRADYIADDIERKWGNRRSVTRDFACQRRFAKCISAAWTADWRCFAITRTNGEHYSRRKQPCSAERADSRRAMAYPDGRSTADVFCRVASCASLRAAQHQ